MQFRKLVGYCRLLITVLVLSGLTVAKLQAGQTDLADVPLNNTSKTKVLPNILLLLDDSGSMGGDNLPDSVAGCMGYSNAGQVFGYYRCVAGEPPFYLSNFNFVYYDPLIDYIPPKNADGTSKTSYTAANSANWRAVPVDGYAPAAGVGNLVSGWPEKVFCMAGNQSRCIPMVANGSYTPPSSTYNTKVSKNGAAFYYTATVEWCAVGATSPPNYGVSGCQANYDRTHTKVRYSGWNRVDILPSRNAYPGANGTTRTYAQEMTNFANWHAWYRTRILLTKTALSLAFDRVRGTPNDADPADYTYLHARVGLAKTTDQANMGQDGQHFLAINTFDAAQKSLWYARMTGEIGGGQTPSRLSLHKAGQIFAGKRGADPVQYSCQRNFVIFASDGYWNDDATTIFPGLDGKDIGDVDGKKLANGNPAVSRPSFDAFGVPNTLSDIAYYYYNTDLRTPALRNCTGARRPDGTSGDVCTNDVSPSGARVEVDDMASYQHVTTFTIGLGVDGSLAYRPDYKNNPSGDYLGILNGTKNWPSTKTDSGARIDDLWHAAVNGRGNYFSARNPASLQTSLQAALLGTQTETGAGGAAASSDLTPTPGEAGSEVVYVASYRTRFWDGDVAAKKIDLTTGAVADASLWNASTLLDARITNPQAGTGGAATDTRTIYVTVDNKRLNFDYANLNAQQKNYFNNAKLSQYATWGAAYQGAATGTTLVNYLRGHAQYEDRNGNATPLYRTRQHVLGDIVHSQPIYVKSSAMTFNAGHDASFGGRMGMLYVAANDGMLHALCTETAGTCTPGKELWAYVIPNAMPNLWFLADTKYSSDHRFLVDGRMATADIYIGGSWKTILVGAMGKGGRGYYAFDITAPDDPKLLWTFTGSDNPNMGFSFGSAAFTKVDLNGDGVTDNNEWRVIVPSGYNNLPNLPKAGDAPTADGGGYLFLLDPATGALRERIATGTGTVNAPSGLAHIQLDVPDLNADNAAFMAYGGDLNGDLWRFDLKALTATRVISLGADRPITTPPEIGLARNGILALYFGSGRYLGIQDLANNSTTQQIIGAVRADASDLVLSKLTQQTGNLIPDWSAGYGWYRTLPAGEQVHIKSRLELGVLSFATALPSASDCKPGASGKLYVIDYASGKDLAAATAYDSLIVGMSTLRLPGQDGGIVITGDGKYRFTPDPPRQPDTSARPPSSSSAERGRRIMWRELID